MQGSFHGIRLVTTHCRSLELSWNMHSSDRSSGNYLCLPSWMGRCVQPQDSIGRVEPPGFSQSSNYPEMLAIMMAFKSFKSVLRYKSVQILSDNIKPIAFINQKVGPATVLSQSAMSIWEEAIDNELSIKCAHIAVRENWATDYWSRTTDAHNWMLPPRLFAYIDRLWGPHTVDRFASCVNAQLPRINSRYLSRCRRG